MIYAPVGVVIDA